MYYVYNHAPNLEEFLWLIKNKSRLEQAFQS